MAQFNHDAVLPDVQSEMTKKEQVAYMFNCIAGKYDFFNRFLSGGIDVGWRKKAIDELKEADLSHVLDVATGTADVAIMTMKRLHPKKITGIDISAGMLQLGKEKIKAAGFEKQIDLHLGDSEAIKFPDNTFTAVTVAFGVRNFENLVKGLAEMLRVMQPGATLVVLEFSKPEKNWFKGLYDFYMKLVAPGFVQVLSKHKKAYQYLNNSVQAFPEGLHFLKIMHEVGFTQTNFKKLSLGICTIYTGQKPVA
jgi:demethylmenaquinone methyltransferase / 2-methoxy-6-polyprenyl-1,4-benzoquinol methylase